MHCLRRLGPFSKLPATLDLSATRCVSTTLPTGTKRQNACLQFAVGLILLAGALLGISPAKDGRDFAGFYELREINDLGDQVSGRFVARVFNYSGGDIVGATILLNDSMLGGDPMAS